MDNFDLRKYLAEGKLHENLQIDDIFGEYVAQWSQGNYDYDFADLKSGSVKGSLVDDFTLGPDEYDDDEYVRDYKIMRDYLLKNRSYKLSQDEKEGLSQFPVQFTLDDDGETIKADIYYSPEYLAMVDADLDEGKLNENLFGAKSEKFGKEIIANLVSDGNKVELVDNFNDVPNEFKKRPDADILAMYGGLKLKQPNKKFIQPEITIAVKGDKEAEEIIKEYPKTYIPDSRFNDKGTIVWLYFAPEDEIKKGKIDPLAEDKINEAEPIRRKPADEVFTDDELDYISDTMIEMYEKLGLDAGGGETDVLKAITLSDRIESFFQNLK